MNHLTRALQHASRGHHVFPVQPNKAPYPGFLDWEARATVDRETVATWWNVDHPDALPAIAPGRSGRVVIDVDVHGDGRPNGLRTLVELGADIPVNEQRPSISGRGFHVWYRGAVRSRNALYPGIDRKGIGGYVVAPYELPPVDQLMRKLPDYFHGSRDDCAEHPYVGGVGDWLAERAGLTPSRWVRSIVTKVGPEFSGHDRMLRAQTALIALGREGHGGVPEALADLRDLWFGTEHASAEDPAAEWTTALVTAVRKFGGSDVA